MSAGGTGRRRGARPGRRRLLIAGAMVVVGACAGTYGGYGAGGAGADDAGAADGADGADDPVVRLVSADCRPPEENRLAEEFAAADLAGTWSLWLFADHGDAEGEAAGGWLALEAYDPDEAPLVGGQPAALFGHLDIQPEQVGAADSGDPAGRSAEQPGVLVLASGRDVGERPNVTLRLGDRSNRLDRMAFDDAYNALHVAAAGDTSFSGRWESGTARGPVAGGRFCAVRSTTD